MTVSPSTPNPELSPSRTPSPIPNSPKPDTIPAPKRSCLEHCKISLRLIPVVTLIILAITALAGSIISANFILAGVAALILVLAAVVAYQILTSTKSEIAFNMKQRLREVISIKDELALANEKLQETVKQSQLNNDKLGEEVVKLGKENMVFSITNSELTETSAGLRQSVGLLEAKLSETDGLNKDLEKAIQGLSLERDQLKKNCDYLQSQAIKFSEDLSTLSSLNRALDAVRRQMSGDAQQIEAGLPVINQCLDKINELQKSAGTHSEETKGCLVQAKELVTSFSDIFSETTKKALLQANASLRENIGLLEGHQAAAQIQAKNLEEEVKGLTLVKQSLDETIVQNRETACLLEQQIQHNEESCRCLTDQIEQQKKILKEMKAQQQSLTKEISILQATIKDLTSTSSGRILTPRKEGSPSPLESQTPTLEPLDRSTPVRQASPISPVRQHEDEDDE